MDPLVSVIITSYNAGRFIGEAVQSILHQSYGTFECLVVDDGSTDQTAATVLSFADPRIRLLQPGRLGRGRALNHGLQQAKGNLIAIQDADDLSHPNRLEIEVRILQEHPEVAVLGAEQWIISGRDEGVATPPANGKTLRINNVQRSLLLINPLSHTSLMARRQILETVGGYDDHRTNLFDWDLLIRLSERGYPPYKLSTPLVAKRIHEEQFFEKRRHFHYVKSCLDLQREAIRRLNRNPLWIVPSVGLFAYRLLPRWLRMAARRCYGALTSGGDQ